jgi:CheY-like chemotaxis protein
MGRQTILIIEDEPEILELAVETLREAGYDVVSAASGSAAMVLFERHPDIDVVFTDIVMSGIDGFKIADMIKIRRPAIGILYTTGYPHLVSAYLGVIHGRILRKPYRQTDLTAAIAATLADAQRATSPA